MNTVGDPISAEEAYEYGLVNRVVEDHELFDTALAWARKFARQAPVALEQIKRVSHAADLDEGLAAERDAFLQAFASEDAREGISAFIAEAHAGVQGQVSAERLAELIRSAGPVVALTGAGISVPSGIPDFRTPDDRAVGERRPDGGRAHLRLAPRPGALLGLLRRSASPCWTARSPTARTGRWPSWSGAACSRGVITQNIDGLHAAAGTRDPIEVHGSIRTASCLACGASFSLAETRARGRRACRAATAGRC